MVILPSHKCSLYAEKCSIYCFEKYRIAVFEDKRGAKSSQLDHIDDGEKTDCEWNGMD